jgi:hypothetical protein
MAEFKFTRFRYNWKNIWAGSTAYNRDDVVRVGGKTYVCIVGHTSNSNFSTDLTANNWVMMTDGTLWRGTWAQSIVYNLGDLVFVSGVVYFCTVRHTSSGSNFNNDLENWAIYNSSIKWNEDWEQSTLYSVGDLVKYNGVVYRCTAGHFSPQTALGIESSDNNLVIHNTAVNSANPGGDVDYVTFTVGDNAISALYLTKYVSVDGIAFFAIQEGPAWTAGVDVEQMLVYSHFGPGAPTGYRVGDNVLADQSVVLAANTTYTMWIQQTGSNITEYLFSTDIDYIAPNISLPADYSDSTSSPTTLSFTNTKWTIYNEGIEYVGDWNNNVRYRPNDLVKFGGSIWKCTEGHTSGDDSSLNFNADRFDIELPGQQYQGEWDHHAAYVVGDIVRYGGYLYVSITNDIMETPSTATQAWSLISKNYNFRNEWSETNDYQTGDVVTSGGNLYLAEADTEGKNLQTIFIDVSVGSGQSSEIGNKFLFDGIYRPIYQFEVGNTYIFNQTNLINVYFPNENSTTPNPHPLNFSADDLNGELGGGTTYLRNVIYKLDENVVTKDEYVSDFITARTRTVTITIDKSTPTLYYWCWNHLNMGNVTTKLVETIGVDPSIDAAWSLLTTGDVWSGGWSDMQSYRIGQLVTYQNNTYRCLVSHISNENENYPDNGNGYNYWELTISGDADNALAKPGDLLSFGVSIDNSTLGPIAVDIGTVSDQLTVQENDTLGYQSHANSTNYIYVGLNGVDDRGYGLNPNKKFKTIRHACEYAETLSGPNVIAVDPGVYEEILPIIIPAYTVVLGSELRSTTIKPAGAIAALSLDSFYTKAALSRLKDIIPALLQNTAIIKTTGNTETQITTYDAGSIPAETAIVSLIDNITEYIDFYLESTALSEPVLFGSNTETTVEGFLNAAAILIANKEFLAAEASAYIETTFQNYVFEPELCKRDVRKYVDAWIYDIINSSNYKSLLAARYYRNAVQGSITDDMFYVRDSSGLRNCTLSGLQGNLNPPLSFELYRRPTGGAYVSLDPGWGPNDERCWIVNRSPYIQGVTTIGTAVTGQKIDGSLHNGGNKSIVSNDFTQVLSDGIGAWVLNGGRAELVSVFTYYCQIGYFAEDGGVIRATNGNCSYGDYGAIADGNDPTETPRYAKVNNRTEQAVAVSAFAGEITDEILIIEFNNAGNLYTQAGYTFTGAGVGASVIQEEFRDDAVNNILLSSTGGGYTLITGNAQSGDDTVIRLGAATTATEVQILGLRITITSGPGTGQYGYVQAYNFGSKDLTVYRESDNQPGWDHVLPGREPAVSLTTQTAYRIEPRLIFSAPPYSSTTVNMSAGVNWANIIYGETTETYTGVVGASGTGTTIDVLPVPASWTVNKVGRTYSVTNLDPGAGYGLNQEIVIDGSELGGVDGDNDLTIVVTDISDDSTNSIIAFRTSGIAASGRFVATGSAASTVAYTEDGVTWNNSTLPSLGNWKCLAAGNNRFVAIQYNSNIAASSTDGINWISRTMPSSRNWNSVVYGGGIFVAVAGDANAGAISTNGTTWAATTLPTAGDSTVNEWIAITYGAQKFVAVANSQNMAAIGIYNSNTGLIAWTDHVMDSSGEQKDWIGVAHGNNRFVALASSGDIVYSFDGETWITTDIIKPDGSSTMTWTSISYAQGVFFATCNTGSKTISGDVTTGPTVIAATSPDGIVWTIRELSAERNWKKAAFGNPDTTLNDSTNANNTGRWIVVSEDLTSNASLVFTGVTAQGRMVLSGGRAGQINIWEPGSGYTEPPTITVIDPNNTSEIVPIIRMGDGALAQPTWLNRGVGYRTSSTVVSIIGNGYADTIPLDRYVVLSDLEVVPGPGSQLRFRGEPDFFTVVLIEEEETQVNGKFTVKFQISPTFDLAYYLENDAEAEIREEYSQCRITGHDFLDVGTGNFFETNYPELYSLADFTSLPENEVYESNGGRVFYTSTDQSGNFRAGELFSVEQATGIVTISADFFDFDGLNELALGGVRLGGSGTVIREFSTDPLFTADSNSIIPTQRAVAAYLSARLSVGGADLEVPSLTAGVTRIGPDEISTTTGQKIDILRPVNFSGPKANIKGMMLAQTIFYASFNVE